MLLSRGVPAKNIVLVLPRARLPGGAFNNAHVEEVVHESLGKLGVKVYKKYKLLKWESANERINSVTIRVRTLNNEKSHFLLFDIPVSGRPTNSGHSRNNLIYVRGREDRG